MPKNISARLKEAMESTGKKPDQIKKFFERITARALLEGSQNDQVRALLTELRKEYPKQSSTSSLLTSSLFKEKDKKIDGFPLEIRDAIIEISEVAEEQKVLSNWLGRESEDKPKMSEKQWDEKIKNWTFIAIKDNGLDNFRTLAKHQVEADKKAEKAEKDKGPEADMERGPEFKPK